MADSELIPADVVPGRHVLSVLTLAREGDWAGVARYASEIPEDHRAAVIDSMAGITAALLATLPSVAVADELLADLGLSLAQLE